MKAKKRGRVVVRVLLVLLIILVFFTLGTFIYHRIKTKQEFDFLKQNGFYNPVSVGEYSLNVYDFGNQNGGHTFVSISGRGVYDLSMRLHRFMGGLAEENRIVLVDRAGYGLSDDTNEPQTLERVVDNYRTALKNSGIEGPYILLPHSIGGAYATYWVSLYPEEIEGVVFLDGTLLDGECDLSQGSFIENRVAMAATQMGLVRAAKSLLLKEEIPGLNYTDEQREYSQALNLHNTFNHAFTYEEEHSNEICDAAYAQIKTNDVPKLYIDADFQTREEVDEMLAWDKRECEFTGRKQPKYPEAGYDMEVRKELRDTKLQPYLDKMGNCELVLLPGIHCIYDQRPDDVAELISGFIDRTEK